MMMNPTAMLKMRCDEDALYNAWLITLGEVRYDIDYILWNHLPDVSHILLICTKRVGLNF